MIRLLLCKQRSLLSVEVDVLPSFNFLLLLLFEVKLASTWPMMLLHKVKSRDASQGRSEAGPSFMTKQQAG